MLDEKKEKEEDDAVEELLAGDVPLLVRGDADGENHHEDAVAHEGEAGKEAEDENGAKDSFDKRDGVAKGVDGALGEWGFCEVLGGGLGEGGCAVVNPDKSVTGEVDANGNAKQRVGERFIVDSHSG